MKKEQLSTAAHETRAPLHSSANPTSRFAFPPYTQQATFNLHTQPRRSYTRLSCTGVMPLCASGAHPSAQPLGALTVTFARQKPAIAFWFTVFPLLTGRTPLAAFAACTPRRGTKATRRRMLPTPSDDVAFPIQSALIPLKEGYPGSARALLLIGARHTGSAGCRAWGDCMQWTTCAPQCYHD